MFKKPRLTPQTTTLWDYPSQHYGDGMQGDRRYKGATPSYVIWNLLSRYSKPGDIVLDPMCGSGTTLDVCKDLGRDGIGFDVAPYRPDIRPADARKLPLKAETVDFVFVDPPYSTHLKYSGHPQCIGELDANGPDYYAAMERALSEMHRVLKPGGHLGLYVSDSFVPGEPFMPIGFELFNMMRKKFEAVDVVAVTRRNRTLQHGGASRAAQEAGYYLRGFNYLFIMKKTAGAVRAPMVEAPPLRAVKPSAPPPQPVRPRKKKKNPLRR